MWTHEKRCLNWLAVSVALVACGLLAFSVAALAEHKGDPHGKPGGGGGGGEEPLVNPALAYVESSSLYVMTSDGSAIQRVFHGRAGNNTYVWSPAWSPDATEIAFLSYIGEDNIHSALYTVHPDGSGLTILHTFTYDNRATEPLPHTEYGLAWLDGTRIHYTGYDACVLDLITGQIQCLGLHLFHDWVGPTSFGPDLNPGLPGFQGLITYAAGDAADEDVYVAEVDEDADGTLLLDPTTITRLILPDWQNFPVFSPDGLQIAFYANQDWCGCGGNKLMVVDVDPTGPAFGVPRLLVDLMGLHEPAWSADSRWIAVTAFLGGSGPRKVYDILRVRPDGTGLTNVTNSAKPREYDPAWNPAWVNDIDP